MDLSLTEEQQLLQDSARDFLRQECPTTHVRAMEEDLTGYSPEARSMDHTNVSHQRWHDHRLFLSHFRKSPRTVGAIAPSSQRLARAMLDGLTLEPGSRVVELGPGTGAIKREIARRLPPGADCLPPARARL